MGSVLGGDGQWLLGDLPTSAIGALSPDGVMLRRPMSDSQQQLEQTQEQSVSHDPIMVSAATAAAQRAQAAVSVAAPVPVSMALPAISSSRAAPSCSLPLMSGAPGGFGFGFGAALAGAAAAAAAAKQCLFDSAFGRAAAAGSSSSSMLPPQHSGTQSVPPAAHGAFGSFIGGSNSTNAACSNSSYGAYGRGLSAPLPRISGLPGRSSLCGAPGSAEMLMQSESMHQPYRPSQHGELFVCLPPSGCSCAQDKVHMSQLGQRQSQANVLAQPAVYFVLWGPNQCPQTPMTPCST
jgi:hypothetical protein